MHRPDHLPDQPAGTASILHGSGILLGVNVFTLNANSSERRGSNRTLQPSAGTVSASNPAALHMNNIGFIFDNFTDCCSTLHIDHTTLVTDAVRAADWQ